MNSETYNALGELEFPHAAPREPSSRQPRCSMRKLKFGRGIDNPSNESYNHTYH